MPDVLVSENIVGPAMDALREALDVAFEPDLWKEPQRLIELAAQSRALIVRNQTQVNSELLAAAGKLEVVGRAGAGLDNIDTAEASRRGVVVSFTPAQNSISVAELALGLMLSLARRIPAADQHAKGGGWDRHRFMGVELYGKTLGVVGFGRIGYLTARRAAAMGMDVVAYDPYVDPDALTVAEARPRLLPLDELLAVSDFVTCHLPGGKETRGLFDYEHFCRMRSGAYFINVARGEVVDELGLVQALNEGRIAGAALDVRSTEPPRSGELETMPNVILLPHVGAFTDEAQQRVVAAVCRDVQSVLSGGRAANYVNFPRPSAGTDR